MAGGMVSIAFLRSGELIVLLHLGLLCLCAEGNRSQYTLNEALYGTPIGRFANMAIALFIHGVLYAKL